MRSRSAAFPVRKRATCCTALEMADGDASALIYLFGLSILRQDPEDTHSQHESRPLILRITIRFLHTFGAKRIPIKRLRTGG
jgi:hypothetical protein